MGVSFIPIKDVKMAVLIPEDVRWGSPEYRSKFAGRRLLLMESRSAAAAGAAQRVVQVDLDTLAHHLSNNNYTEYAKAIINVLAAFPESMFYPYSPQAAHLQAFIEEIRGTKVPESEQVSSQQQGAQQGTGQQGTGTQTQSTLSLRERLVSPTHPPTEEQDVPIMSTTWWATLCSAVVTAAKKAGTDPLDTTPPTTNKAPLNQPITVWKDWTYIEQRFAPSDPKFAILVKKPGKWRLLFKLTSGELAETDDPNQISDDAKKVVETTWKAFFRQMTPVVAPREYREAIGERGLASII